MAKEKKIVSIELDKVRHLWFNLNSLIMVEKLTGTNFKEIGGNMGLDMVRALLFAGLMWEDKELTVEQVGELIDFDNLEMVMEKLSEAMNAVK